MTGAHVQKSVCALCFFVTVSASASYYKTCGGLSAQVLRTEKEDSVMKLDLFDDIDGIIFHEREASLGPVNKDRNNMNGQGSLFPDNTPLAMAYVPFQQWGETYSDDKALSSGTLFPQLDLPFVGGGDGR